MTLDPLDGPAPARLLALRLHGFKSFAERTVVEFGAGISAVVGPNGSGKSNLADALRWALGEQGRALRSRKAEDVIWAGSERRAAQGMADVTILLDNADGLLPVDYQVLELGRRLYRSGENDYLLNRQRVRLRDLVDLLDGAHLADNAFLFIGQGMVDQALALRPEERRPLFEEVAGVRRHERRRRKAEEQLAESEANLARVEDIVAELRPQARRLAAQAEQQATRVGAGDELAAALLLAAHARWFEASARAGAAADRRATSQAEADTAMQELQTAEEAASGLAQELGARSVVETERRATLDAAQAAVTALRLREERAAADLEGIARDRSRLLDERAVAETDLVVQRRALSQPLPARDVELDGELGEAERALSDALAELATLRASDRARGEDLAAVRRAEAVRQAELETARRRLADVERRATEAAAQVDAAGEQRATVEAVLTAAQNALAEATEAERRASVARAARTGSGRPGRRNAAARPPNKAWPRPVRWQSSGADSTRCLRARPMKKLAASPRLRDASVAGGSTRISSWIPGFGPRSRRRSARRHAATSSTLRPSWGLPPSAGSSSPTERTRQVPAARQARSPTRRSANGSWNAAVASSPRRCAATPTVPLAGCSGGPSGCRTWTPVLRSSPTCHLAGSPCRVMERPSSRIGPCGSDPARACSSGAPRPSG